MTQDRVAENLGATPCHGGNGGAAEMLVTANRGRQHARDGQDSLWSISSCNPVSPLVRLEIVCSRIPGDHSVREESLAAGKAGVVAGTEPGLQLRGGQLNIIFFGGGHSS
jgi:hypothetical protein